jgi:hypothetical protein
MHVYLLAARPRPSFEIRWASGTPVETGPHLVLVMAAEARTMP